MTPTEKVIYSILSIAIVALAWAVGTFYVVNNNQSISLEQEQATVLATYAKDVWTQTRDLVDSFLMYHELTESDQNLPNMTENINFLNLLEARSFNLLNYEAGSARDIVQTDSQALSDFDSYHGGQYGAYDDAYHNVSETVNYAVNQLDWTTGRLPNDHIRLMYELCHVLGADQYMATGNSTQLTGISQAFFSIYLYWDNQSKNQPNSIALSTELGWVLGNATQLYQNLVDWHDRNPQ